MLDQVFAARRLRPKHGGLPESCGWRQVDDSGGRSGFSICFGVVGLLARPGSGLDYLKPAMPFPDLFPEIGGAMPAFGGRRGCPAPPWSPSVERQEDREFVPVQPGRHVGLHGCLRRNGPAPRPERSSSGSDAAWPLGLGRRSKLDIDQSASPTLCVKVGFEFRRRHRQAV